MMQFFNGGIGGIVIIFGFLVAVPLFLSGAEALKIIEPGKNRGETANSKTSSNGTSPGSEIANYLRDVTSRTLGSSQIFDMLYNQIYDAISNITLIASGLGNDIQGTVQNQTGNGGSCNQVATQLWNAIKIPIFIIAPAVIIGVVLAIKKIGLITAWIPSITGPWFEGIKGSGDSDSGGYGGGGGWPSPSSGYGYDAAPTSGYGAPPTGSSGGLSRQTAILEAIDNLSNMYGGQQYSQQVPSNSPELLGNYGDQGLQDYQGGQSLQNSPLPQPQVANNYPYYYYTNPNLNPNPIDYSKSEKVNLDNSPGAGTGTGNLAG